MMQSRNTDGNGWHRINLGVALAALAMMVVHVSGCASTSKGPTVERLPDGRPGFIIRDASEMKGPLRADFGRAVALLEAGNNLGAIELLNKVIVQAPDFEAPYINLAIAYMRTGKQDLAEKHFKTALYLVPGHPVASNEYGLLLRARADFNKARKVFERSTERFPEYPPVRRNLGILCDLYLGDPSCALEQFEIYSQNMPSDEQVKLWIAELRIRLGKN